MCNRILKKYLTAFLVSVVCLGMAAGGHAWASEEAYTPLEQFVVRLYQEALGREVDHDGFEDWTGQLERGKNTGAGVATGFIMSDEFQKKHLSDEQYVEILYRTFLNREPDNAGRTNWLHLLANSVSRTYVFRGFAESEEFENLCERYGIVRGNVDPRLLSSPADQNSNVTMFVSRCYEKTLNRKPDAVGLNDWTNQILTGAKTADQVAYGFVFSNEFLKKNTSDEEYVKTLYRLFMDREADDDGLTDWTGQLAQKRKTRLNVFYGFAASDEFAELCSDFGLGVSDERSPLDEAADSIIGACTDSSMTQDQKLYACYQWIINNCSYKGLRNSERPKADERFEEYYALRMYRDRKGNCYCFASLFQTVAQRLGYEDACVKVGETRRTNASVWAEHGWVEIGGKKYDLSFADTYPYDLSYFGASTLQYRETTAYFAGYALPSGY